MKRAESCFNHSTALPSEARGSWGQQRYKDAEQWEWILIIMLMEGIGNALAGCLFAVLMPILAIKGAGGKAVSRTCPQHIVRGCFLVFLSCYVFSPITAL